MRLAVHERRSCGEPGGRLLACVARLAEDERRPPRCVLTHHGWQVSNQRLVEGVQRMHRVREHAPTERHRPVAFVKLAHDAGGPKPGLQVLRVGDGGRSGQHAQPRDGHTAHLGSLADRHHASDDRLKRRAARWVGDLVYLIDEQQPHAADDALRVAAEAREGVPLLGCRDDAVGGRDRALVGLVARVAGELDDLQVERL